MKVFSSLAEINAPLPQPLALTIGNFDGLHIGHLSLLRHLHRKALYTALLTFPHHPHAILHQRPILQLTTLAHKLYLLEEQAIDFTILLPFTPEFSRQSARDFLLELHRKISFTHLILGHDAAIGHDRNRDLSPITHELGVEVEYLSPLCSVDGTPISSRQIRCCILQGDLQQADSLLGRPYSILAPVQRGAGKGHSLLFPTANLSVEGLALPPLGVYVVAVRIGSEILPGVANLGAAPTLHPNRPICLEVHLLEEERDLYDQLIEVTFLHYIRTEKHFATLAALKEEIQLDIEKARHYLQCMSISS